MYGEYRFDIKKSGILVEKRNFLIEKQQFISEF